MGYIRHHAIIVTGTYGDHAERAREQACKLATKHGIGGWGAATVSPMVGPLMNDARTFVVAPDGSKEGWETSDEGDDFREAFVKWLREQAYEDGSSSLAWAEIQYGDDNGISRVAAHSDEGEE